ncbi:MAG: hypothetical protein FD143_1949 [Ignavibacteria bacterium]|nr:MAG: hypothetical protein FD143_1949 [Ignavibacteria bacterium]KAF0159897.1 MAG: hypothetical protein FD188_2022 [Ignavibacteria bacterium]
MAELKTQKTDASVSKFLASLSDKQKKEDSFTILEMLKKASKSEPKMWGGAIIGLKDRKIKYESGRELDWFTIGFSPRKQNIALYLPGGYEAVADVIENLGKYKTGKGCLYINKLSDVDTKVLQKTFNESVKRAKENCGC